VSNENDENSSSTRVTRAKSARLTNSDDKALQTKKSAVNANPQAAQRKRAALGDVSNVTKVDVVEGKKTSTVGKTGLVSKAAQPTGIQKTHSRTASSRTVLATKEAKKTEVKRAGSGSGAIGVVQKRKISSTASSTSAKDGTLAEDSEPLRKKLHTLESETRARSVGSGNENAFAKLPVREAELEVEIDDRFPERKDLDSEDHDDPFMVAEYATEIFDYLKGLEVTSAPNPNYMEHQDDLEWKTRGILVDWLIEVHTRFHLLPETLFLTVNIIDRFLSEKVVQLDRLQLVGVTAMFIASKYEEVLSPHVANFRHVADDGFTEAEILSAERFVLSTLNYDLSYPNPMNFLRRISKADDYDIQSRTIGKYLTEISLLDPRFMEYPPSQVAAGAMFLSRLILDRGEWVCFTTHGRSTLV
jgi:G2/mitotic-specific cyclin 2